jgi:hypothetical protein
VNRASNWRGDAAQKAQMERSIPIFRALIACDHENRYHRNHGQLGYALKDQRKPDYRGAEEELGIAIQIRGDQGWPYYEANRALCRIVLDAANSPSPSSESVKSAIAADLAVAYASPLTAPWVRREKAVQDWLLRNGLAEDTIRQAGS